MTGHISRRLPAYAALAAAGLVAGLALGRVEPVALAAPFLLARRRRRGRPRAADLGPLTLDRDRALEGDEVTATVEVSSPGAASTASICSSLLPPELSIEGGPARAIRLRAGEERTIELPLRASAGERSRSGRCSSAPATARPSLVGGHGGEAQTLRVYPTEETLRSLVAPLETQVFAGNQVSRARGEGIEFADLREWQPGDRVRRVNWRATALRRTLWVNEQNPERNTDVVLFLDTFAEVRGRGAEHERPRRARRRDARARLSAAEGPRGAGRLRRVPLLASARDGHAAALRIIETLLTSQSCRATPCAASTCCRRGRCRRRRS